MPDQAGRWVDLQSAAHAATGRLALGASTPGSPPTLATCYRAAWPLPRRVLPQLAMEPFAGRTWLQAS